MTDLPATCEPTEFNKPTQSGRGLRDAVSGFARELADHRWPVIGLFVLTVAVYFPVASFDFLNWDDTWYIVRNDLIKSWHPVNLYRIATEPVARNFAPLTIGTFLVEHTLWGMWPGGYHVTNLLLHGINAILVFLLLRQLTSNDWVAWTAAALFALHPVQVETVAWVSSRKTLLSATFMLASLICWLKTDRTSRDEGWGILWLILALLSKAAAVVVPPIVVAYDVFIARKKPAESIPRQVVPMFLCVMLILVTMSAQTTIVGGVRSHIGNSKLWIIAIDSTLLWRYVAMLIWPVNLNVLYDPPTEGIALLIAASLISWGAIMGFAWKVRERFPWLAFGVATWLLLLFPVLNFFPITTLMNDRYLYLPCVPFFALAVGGASQLLHKLRGRSASASTALATILSTALLAVAAWSTLGYLPVWKEPLLLWHHARQETPSLTVVHIQWAITLESLGHTEQAQAALETALAETDPDEGDRRRIQEMMDRLAPSSTRGDSVGGTGKGEANFPFDSLTNIKTGKR
ncbi:MAG: hypothetical protein KDA80_18385 [Planctomycetaceae bacterium]|nr:hypothetical protein [Planctomycetaceae bacterium]